MTVDHQSHLKFKSVSRETKRLVNVKSFKPTLTSINTTSHFSSTHLSQIWNNVIEQSIATLCRVFNKKTFYYQNKAVTQFGSKWKWTAWSERSLSSLLTDCPLSPLRTVRFHPDFAVFITVPYCRQREELADWVLFHPRYLNSMLWVINDESSVWYNLFYLRITNANVIHLIPVDHPLGLVSGI